MTKNNIKLAVLVAFVFVAVSVGGSVSAANLVFEADTNVTINSNNYIIYHGSAATSLEVGATTLTVTVPTGSTFKLISTNKYLLNNDKSVSQDCFTYQSELLITGDDAATVITPVATACQVAGGGGGDSYVYVAPAVDTTPPTNTSVSISAGAATTNSLAVTLTLAATDAAQMMISNDSAFTGGTWETYATSKSWTLSSGEGTKTVYAKFKDSASNASTAVSDTITYSATATTQTQQSTTQQLGPITISKPLNQMTRDELVSTLLKLILTLFAQGKLTHL